MREDLTDEPLRFFPVWSYLLVDRDSRPLEIVRVLQGARDVTKELRRKRR